jgi:hypothetical protein
LRAIRAPNFDPGALDVTLTLTRTRLVAGVWEGVLAAPEGAEPRLAVTHLGQALEGVEVLPLSSGQWAVRIPVPPAMISEGVQTFLIADAESGAGLGSFALVAGEALADDLRAEVSLLRAELEMLKQAFRRYAAEHP